MSGRNSASAGGFDSGARESAGGSRGGVWERVGGSGAAERHHRGACGGSGAGGSGPAWQEARMAREGEDGDAEPFCFFADRV